MSEGSRTQPTAGFLVERFWCGRAEELRLGADGFLLDPSRRGLGWSLNPAALPTEALVSSPCVVVLGEPGAGKSTALGAPPEGQNYVEGLLSPAFSGAVLRVRLDDYGDEVRLFSDVLDGVSVREWMANDGWLALVLDSFDECQLRLGHLSRLLANRLEGWPTTRLVLRIACRTAQWPTALEAALTAAFGEVKVVELAPLRFEDAVSIATSLGHDGPQTLGALVAAGAGPLASRPLTLKMLLDDPLPAASATGIVDLYQRAARRLATEPDPFRQAPRSRRSPEAAVPAARRIAAALLFGGKSAVTSSHENPGADELAVDDLVVGDEPSRTARTVITADLIRSTLDSALFTSRGAGRLGFAHFSFAEHLAAEWLAENELGQHQLKQLLMSRDGTVLPELRNVAAWLMARNATVYGWLASDDPDVVLAGAVPIESEEVCARATAQVLSEAKTRAWDHVDYRGLRHPGIAGQLRAALSSSDLEERLLAAELAGDCEVRDVEPELLAIVFDATEQSTMRVRAAAGIAAIHRESPTDVLVAIVRDPLLAESGELLGVALHASWPHALDVPAVLASLAPLGRPHVLDAFRMFVNYTFAPALTVEDLGAALPWLDELEAQGVHLDAFDGLVDRIVTLACDATDGEHDSVLARLIWRRVQAHEPLVSSHGRQEGTDPLADAGRRRAVLLHVLAEGLRSGETDLVYTLAYGPAAGVCRPEDFGWLATIGGTLSPELSAALAQLAVQLFTPHVESCREDLLALPESNPVRAQLQFWLGSRRIDDPLGEVWRSRRRKLEVGPTNEEVENSIARELDRVDDGDLDGYWAADLLLAIPLGGHSPSFPADVDFAQRERWSTLSVATQEHFVQAAERYVNGAENEPDEWLGKPVLHHPSRSGVHALILLRSRLSAVYRALPEVVWAKWAPSILDAIRFTGGEPMESLFVDARTFAVDELRTSAVRVIESQLGGDVFLKSEILESLWDLSFEDGLLDVLAHAPEPSGRSLRALIAAQSICRLRSGLRSAVKSGPLEGRLAAGQLLAYHGNSADWLALIAASKRNVSFGRQLFTIIASTGRKVTVPLDVAGISKLYIELVAMFPPNEDGSAQSRSVSRREQVSQWRDGLVDLLAQRADEACVAELRSLVGKYPDRTGIRRSLRDALERRRRSEIRRVSPSELVNLARGPDRQLVHTAADLRALVCRVLENIQRDVLQGNVPEAQHLWDEVVMRPKTEEAIADFLSNRLQERLLAASATVLREVQTRRPGPAGIPERTDIRVDAHPPNLDRSLTVIVECKGVWNSGLMSEMRAQLVDRYMADTPGAEGIYAVIWFDSAKWDGTGDKRRPKAARLNLETVRNTLEGQASDLCAEGYGVSTVLLDASYNRPERDNAGPLRTGKNARDRRSKPV